MPGDPAPVHASAVALWGRGVLVLGAAGAGKSSLALTLMAHGARLIADDRTCLAPRDQRLLAWAPKTLLGRIEARGVGILFADPAPPTPIALAVDLDQAEADRIPPKRSWAHCDIAVPLILGRANPSLPHAILQWMKGGRADDP